MPAVTSKRLDLSAISEFRCAQKSKLLIHRTETILTLLFLAFLLRATISKAQQDGVPPFSVADRYEVDTIDLLTLNPTLNIPAVSKAGLIPFTYTETAQQSCSQSYQNGYSQTDHVSCGLAFSGYTNSMVGMYVTATQRGTVWCQGSSGLGWYTYYTDFILASSDNLDQHVINGSLYTCGGATSFTSIAIDGSGYTVSASINTTTAVISYTITSAAGHVVSYTSPVTNYTETDPFGNTVKVSNLGGSYSYTDSMGLTVAYYALVNGNTSIAWPDTTDAQQAISLVKGTGLTSSTNWPCTYSQGSSIITPYSSITYPDGTSIGLGMEQGVNGAGTTTGRLGSITLRTGAQVSYAYGPLTAVCYSTLPAYATWLERTTPDGTTTYTKSGGGWPAPVTTVVDPGGNKTVYTFSPSAGGSYTSQASVITQIQKYQNTGTVASPVYSLQSTDTYCFNGNQTTCSTATVNYPITQEDIYHLINGMASSSRITKTFDAYGNITSEAKYDFGASAYTTKTSTTFGSWNGTSCVAVSTTINNLPCDVLSQGGGNNVSEVRYTYNVKGSLLTTYEWTGTSWLSNATVDTYNSNGTVATSYDMANNKTTYTYSSANYSGCAGCTNYPFPTSIAKGGLTASSTWNGWGGVKLTDTDPNGSVTTYGYSGCSGGATDPFWRVLSVTDPLNNEVCKTYPSGSSPNTLTSSFSFNSGKSIQKMITTLDGLGRTVNVQTQQGPAATMYDTVSTSYAWSGSTTNKRVVSTNVPCPESLNGTCPLTSQRFTDILGRTTWSSTPATGEYVSTTYSENDALSTLGPASPGENTKAVQTQYDGLGRVQSVCGIMNSGGYSTCSQNSGAYSGQFTTYTYTSPVAGSTTVKATRGAQSRSVTNDGLGRATSSTTPEGGTITNYYDSYTGSLCGSTYTHAGKLVLTVSGNGNGVCYTYDSLGRITSESAFYAGGGTSACRRFYYDNSTGVLGALPAGVSLANSYGRLVEAETDNCVLPVTSASIITDEWFSYDKDGNKTDLWEYTPHSGTYFHSQATFAGNGAPLTVKLANPSLYTETYGLDGEGRLATLTSGIQAIVSGTTYNAASQPTYIDLGTGTDQSDYVYDPNTGKMTKWTFQVGSTGTETGVLNWNPNGTLQQLAITDGFNAGSQTCTFGTSSVMGYDDLGRLLSDNCGSVWAQTFSYDQYDNITKAGSISWNPGYNSANNHYNVGSYDNGGNVLSDTIHSYSWNQFNKMGTVDSSACGTNGECVTYDAFGRIVETSFNNTYTELWYTQLGRAVYMQNGSPYYAYWPTPGGGTVEINGNNVTAYYMHKDWLGNSRISSTIVNHTVISDQAYAPYGEVYNKLATGAAQPAQMFTSDTQDILGGIWDTPNRELNASQGRWLSPDPAGTGWNQYAYTGNPLSATDPSGLTPGYASGDFGGCNAFAVSCGDRGGWWLIGGGDEFDWAGVGGLGIYQSALHSGNPFAANYNELNYNPIQFEFQGTLFGKYYDETFSSVEEYASWRTGVAAEPESQAFSVVEAMCSKNLECDPNQAIGIVYRFAYLVPNVKLDCDTGSGCNVEKDNLDGFWKDPLTFLHQGSSSWYSGFFFDDLHLIDSDPVSGHIDPFGPFNPLHYILQMPAMIPDMISPPGWTYMSCSLSGGCFAQ
jgi:RHS repeat-associated protein